MFDNECGGLSRGVELSIIISQHVCEHWNYLVCFVENGSCRNCDWKTPDLLNTANWIIFWSRQELLFLKPVATSKEEFLENQNKINELMHERGENK